MLTVLTIDMRKGLPAVDSDSLMTDAQTVYASRSNLYVATQRWLEQPTTRAPLPAVTTAIHQFDTSEPDRTEYRATGVVTGFLLSQWSLSEYKGDLRVASTDEPVWFQGREARQSESFMTVLRRDGSALLPIGRVGNLGKGERIYAVRFIDDLGFLVTFRQVDPLYVIDLSPPTNPEVLGELKILGYSAYLHPVGDDLLLGVGQDATEEGRTRGTQLSLFDVSNPREPKRIAQRTLGDGSSSQVEYDHHAFLFWPPTRLTVLPLALYQGESQPFVGAVGFRVAGGIAELGRVTHGSGEGAGYINRSVVVGDRLFTISELGVKASSLDTLTEQAWVAFPQPPGP
jgi:hypothetical protein